MGSSVYCINVFSHCFWILILEQSVVNSGRPSNGLSTDGSEESWEAMEMYMAFLAQGSPS